MKCNECQNENICHDGNHELTRHGCAENGWCCFVPITNADKIRSMTDEELADFLWSIGQSPFNGWTYISGKPMFEGNGWAAWLKAAADKEGET